MEILDHGGDVDAFGAQLAVRNLVAHLVELHGPLPLVAAPVQHERQAVPETQPGVVRIEQAPRPAVPPLLLRLPRADGFPAGVAYLRFQLAPGLLFGVEYWV